MPNLAKRILIVAAALVVIAILGLLFLNLYVQSAAATATIERKLSASLGMPIRITSASFTPWSGLRMSGISSPGTGGEGDNFFEAAGFGARFEFAPLFRRELVINDVTVEDPQVSWVQNEKGKWRLPAKTEAPPVETALPEPKAEHVPRREPVKPFIISVQRFRVLEGRFDFLDAQQQPVISFSGVNVDAPRAEERHLEGKVNCKVAAFHGAPVLENLKTPFAYEAGPQGALKLPEISATIAAGVLTGDFAIQPELDDSPFSCSANFRQVDLNQLVVVFGGMPGQASGQVDADLKLAGEWNDGNKISGGGRLTLASGSVRQYEFLQLLGQVLQIEELSRLTLQRAEADYRIADGKIFIDRLELQSPNLKLSATGKIKFNGKLDLDARLTINERLSRQLPKRIDENFTPVADSSARFVDFDITGTWARPKTNLQQKILGKSYESQALNVLKNLLGGSGAAKKETRTKAEKKKMELAPAPSATPMIPELTLPPIPDPSASPEPATRE